MQTSDEAGPESQVNQQGTFRLKPLIYNLNSTLQVHWDIKDSYAKINYNINLQQRYVTGPMQSSENPNV